MLLLFYMIHILTQLRQLHGYTQEELAHMLNMSRQHLANIERGEADLKLTQARQCGELFNISIDALSLGKLPTETATIATEQAQKKNDAEERNPVPQLSFDPAKVQKFKEVLLYILEQVGARPNVGKTVLFKLLYFCDFDFYEKYEEQLTGATYRKIAHGPAPVEFAEIAKQMKKGNELQEVRGTYYDKEQLKFLPLRKPNLQLLDAHELAMVDDVLRRHAGKTASEISTYSHRDVPWRVHGMGEAIEYESVFYRDEEFSVREDEEL